MSAGSRAELGAGSGFGVCTERGHRVHAGFDVEIRVGGNSASTDVAGFGDGVSRHRSRPGQHRVVEELGDRC